MAPLAGSKLYDAAPTMSAKLVAVALPCTAMVWVRAPQPDRVGVFSTTLLMLTDEPRSTWSHSGKALFVLSQ